MESVLKVANPATAFTVVVPFRTPLPGFAPIATVIASVLLVTGLPWASSTCTVTGGAIAVFACEFEGGWMNAICVGVPKTISVAVAVPPFRLPPLPAVTFPVVFT
jgi:hypothetical protein